MFECFKMGRISPPHVKYIIGTALSATSHIWLQPTGRVILEKNAPPSSRTEYESFIMCSHGHTDTQWRGKSKLHYRDQAMVGSSRRRTSAGNQTPPHMRSDSVSRCLQGLAAAGRHHSRALLPCSEVAMDNGIHLEEDDGFEPHIEYLQVT